MADMTLMFEKHAFATMYVSEILAAHLLYIYVVFVLHEQLCKLKQDWLKVGDSLRPYV